MVDPDNIPDTVGRDENSYRKALLDEGWEEPLDGSPVETPEGWEGGAVEETGGHIRCRIWRHEDLPLGTMYNLHDDVVALELNRDDEDNYVQKELKYVETGRTEDLLLAEAAVGLMEQAEALLGALRIKEYLEDHRSEAADELARQFSAHALELAVRDRGVMLKGVSQDESPGPILVAVAEEEER